MKRKTHDRWITLLSLIILPVNIWAYIEDHTWLLLSATAAFIASIYYLSYKNGVFAEPEIVSANQKIWWLQTRLAIPVLVVLIVSTIAFDWKDGDLFDGPDQLWNHFFGPALGIVLILFFFVLPLILGWRAGSRLRKRKLREEE